MTRLFAILAALGLAAPAVGQPAMPPPRFNPAAAYITAGQDEPGYKAWLASQSWRTAWVSAFHDHLARNGVGDVVPTWQLLRTATMWRECGADPFEVPPPTEWPHLVETLRYVQKHIVPVIGPVEPVSVYRNPVLNQCAGGAADSAHRQLFAIDLVPLRPTTREGLMKAVCAIHAWQGPGFDVGLGFYKGLRFHVDSRKYRKWGAAMGDDVTVGCPHLLARIESDAAAAKAAIAARQGTAPVVPTPPPVETPPPTSH